MKVVILAVMTSLAVTACSEADSGDEDGSDISETSQSIIGQNALTTNRIATNRIATNRIATNRIATNRISAGRFALAENEAGELLTTADGRELLTYIVSCALAKNQSVEGTYAGTTYTFAGDLGLARNWVNRALDGSDQRWVSACLLSRVNAHDKSLVVSLRGPNGNLHTSRAESATYAVEEGAFYGNVFIEPELPLIAFACRGLDQARGEPTEGTSPLSDRDCTEPTGNARNETQCGFTFAGNCAAFDLSSNAKHDDGDDGDDGDDDDDDVEAPHACESQTNSYYTKCHTEPSDTHGEFPTGTRYREVITVFLAE